MTEFVLNRELHKTELPKGMVLLDYIRSHAHLKGTKITCREGDCGACTVLLGTLKGEEIHYDTIVSCISPLGMVHGKHVHMQRTSNDQRAVVTSTQVSRVYK